MLQIRSRPKLATSRCSSREPCNENDAVTPVDADSGRTRFCRQGDQHGANVHKCAQFLEPQEIVIYCALLRSWNLLLARCPPAFFLLPEALQHAV